MQGTVKQVVAEQQTVIKQQIVAKQQTVRDYYSKAQFWDQRYIQKVGFFDWYAQFPQLQYAFQNQYNITTNSSILMIGCGNSKLSSQMYCSGYHKITNIDISPTVIQQMKQISPEMQWIVMDALNMTFQQETFDFVIDKGTMDALIAGRDLNPAVKLLKEAVRVTKEEGQLILITYGSPQGRKRVFQQALQFNMFDYYFAYVNLSDLSTMINLMRNNLVGPNGQKIQQQQALQRSMKQFLMVKLMRQRRSKQKQFIVWQNYSKKKTQQMIQVIPNQQATTTQTKQSQQKPSQSQPSSQVLQKSVIPPTIKFISKQQKQSFVYAYSIKRKLGYDFDHNKISSVKVQKSFQGDHKVRSVQIRAEGFQHALAKAIQFCNEKKVAYPNVKIIQHHQQFSHDQRPIKLNFNKNNDNLKIILLQKSNIDLKITFNNLNSLKKLIQRINISIQQSLGLSYHPCPKTYSLFSMIKSRMQVKTTRQLLLKYWYPTFTHNSISSSTAILTISFPPVLPYLFQLVINSISTLKIKDQKIKIISKRQGFVSFPQLDLFGLLNQVGLSWQKGIPLKVQMLNFTNNAQHAIEQTGHVEHVQGKDQIVHKQHANHQQGLSQLYHVRHPQVQIPQHLIPIALIHLLVLY